jgi:cytochrome c oxidase assembly protein subunit 15
VTTLVSADSPPDARTTSVGLYRFAVFVVAYVLLHIKWGALVTSTGAGMAFTDWPLAHGSLWPAGMELDELLEHLHRVSGAVVGLLTITLAIWVRRVDRRRWLRNLSWLLLGLVVLQGVLGGLGVLLGDADGRTWAPAAIGHGVLAQPTLCLGVVIAFALAPAWRERIAVPAEQARSARRLATVAIASVFLQLFIGAVVRHTDQQGMLWLHVFMAIAVSCAIMVASAYASGRFGARSRGIRVLGVWIFAVLLAQLALGFATLALRRFKDPSNIEYVGRSVVVSSHVVVGATLFLLATLLLARCWRNLVPEPEGQAG